MANATDRVPADVVRRTSEHRRYAMVAHASLTTYYPGGAIGINAAGYAQKFDDTASLRFIGQVAGDRPPEDFDTNTAGADKITVNQPQRFELAIASVARTDIGKTVYALDDQTGTLDPDATVYGNVYGKIVDYVAAGVALVEPVYNGTEATAFKAARIMAATGAQTITVFDLGKTIIVPNTATLTITLPPVASCPAGSELQFIKSSADAAAITLDGNASETIDGSATYAAMDALNDCAKIVSTGTAWVIAARDVA